MPQPPVALASYAGASPPPAYDGAAVVLRASSSLGEGATFRSAGEYADFMTDPWRVIRLEWRKVRRPQHRGWTSHSWLEGHLLGGQRLRLELFADQGLSESVITGSKGTDPNSVIYDGRVADAHEFVCALTADELRGRARKVAARPYSVDHSNCHHFVRDVWNTVVIERLRRTHYPDRFKTSVLATVSASLQPGWLSGLRSVQAASPCSMSSVAPPEVLESAASRAASSSAAPPPLRGDDGLELMSEPEEDDEGGRGSSRHTRLSAWCEAGNRVSGELLAPGREAPGYDQAGRQERFLEAVGAGAVRLLRQGGALEEAKLPRPAPARGAACQAWVERWLPHCASAATRLAERMDAADVLGLVPRILGPILDPVTLEPGTRRQERSPPRSPDKALASLGSQSASASADAEWLPLADACFVVLDGQELRVAIYAVLRPDRLAGLGGRAQGMAAGTPKRLRLLSGDAKKGQEGAFAYALSELPPGLPTTSAEALAKAELESLQIAMTTGDWAFVTLL